MDDQIKIDHLKKQRGAFKGQLTNLRTRLITVSTIGALESCLHRLHSIYEKYDYTQAKLEPLDDASGPDRVLFDDEYLTMESAIRDKLHDTKRAEETVSTSFHNTSIHELSPNSPYAGIKLPEIVLPTFNGMESEWLAFRDVFCDLIHSKKLDPTIKFLYLTSSVRAGSAYSFIESLPVTATNYEIAWNTLCDHYNNEVAIQRLHMRELYDVRITQENSPKLLQWFVDKVVKHVSALKSLKVKVNEWDLLLVHHLIQRLDNASRVFIVKNTKPKEIMSLSELLELLRSRVKVLHALSANSAQTPSRLVKPQKAMSFNVDSVSAMPRNGNNCAYCKGDHNLTQCPVFTGPQMTPKLRLYFIKALRLCGNCLLEHHLISQCNKNPCNRCSNKHHTLLHFDDINVPRIKTDVESHSRKSTVLSCSNQEEPISGEQMTVEASCSAVHAPELLANKSEKMCTNLIILGTALVHASINDGIRVTCRALLDSGSTLNFVTEQTCKILQVRRYPTSKIITGIGACETLIKHKVFLTISSRCSNFAVSLKLYVLPVITKELPSIHIPFTPAWLPEHLSLADPYFHVPDRIDLLLGAEVYHQLLKGTSFKLREDLPPLVDSEFGHVICGKLNTQICQTKEQHSHIALCSTHMLEARVKQFWELEQLPTKPCWSQEETACEEHYKDTVIRTSEGRYQVGLPTNTKLASLGLSYLSAVRQFIALEKRLQGNQEIRAQYIDFMNEYQNLGHMSKVSHDEHKAGYYLPHHYVIKPQSSTTKLRVVFNASSKTSSGMSLNDCLMIGPTIQPSLITTLLRFRKHIVAFCGDITKMYRQILIHEHDRHFQQILWRNSPSETLQTFTLNTVTYGTACAPFLAIRTLKQLASDEYSKFPNAARVLEHDFYVDDVLTGASTLDEAIILKQDLIDLLQSGGFELRKFLSNAHQLTSSEQSTTSVNLVLGVLWNIETDVFEIQLNKLPVSSKCTKRIILSEICQLFDPLGICAPIILTAKLVMQSIWKLQDVGWDVCLPHNISQHWKGFKEELHSLHQVTVPRLITTHDRIKLELHGFCDASERAYGGVVYARTVTASNQHKIVLLCSKSRVAPLKIETIPRLELCAAVLVSELIHKIINTMEITFDSVHLWTDSTITLFRIRSEPYRFTTFVANRLTKIHEITSKEDWRHVPTVDNPADMVSRGLMPSQLVSSSIWWNGPEFLRLPSSSWPTTTELQITQELSSLECRKPPNPTLTQQPMEVNSIFDRFSCLTRLHRVVAFIYRFINNSRSSAQRVLSTTRQLQPDEINNASLILIRLVQQQHFTADLRALRACRTIHNSSIRALSPFLDKDGLLRVGGRLSQADITRDHKHPVLLPGKHPLTTLIVRHEHVRNLHAGPQALLYSVRQSFWIIGGRNICRKIVHSCVRCFRTKPSVRNQIMGDLPLDRVHKVDRAFTIVGVDFCGPFIFKQTRRSKIQQKCYCCLFICFATKAVHLDIVTDASSEAFLACLKRFVARRGLCSKIISDNATHFIGARNELQKLKRLFLSQTFQEPINKFCSEHNIEWKTIPPRSPHFGGLWESAIKSAKHHLKRVIGTHQCTLEELFTLTTQIEACLNSRPITPLSNDPSDTTALSPGHFIIGAPLNAIPEPSLLDLKINRLSNFQKIQQMMQRFWTRWQNEYLSELQQRNKWQSGIVQFRIGDLVVLHEDNLPPLQWKLGRIVDLHPGQDGVIRVASIKTSSSTFRRATNRISLLPSNDPN